MIHVLVDEKQNVLAMLIHPAENMESLWDTFLKSFEASVKKHGYEHTFRCRNEYLCDGYACSIQDLFIAYMIKEEGAERIVHNYAVSMLKED